MKRGCVLALIVLLVAFALPAMADTDMTFIGAQGNQSGGVFTYPYNFTVGSQTDVLLMCDSFMSTVNTSTYSASVIPITAATGGSAYFMASFHMVADGHIYTPQDAYDAAGLLYLGAMGEGPLKDYVGISDLSKGLANWAVWSLFDPGLGAGPTGVTSPFTPDQLVSLESVALGAVKPTNNALLAGVNIYTPTNLTHQEFIGGSSPVPEPSSLMLLGSGMLGLAGAVRRRLLR
jgi:hypothetical protein